MTLKSSLLRAASAAAMSMSLSLGAVTPSFAQDAANTQQEELRQTLFGNAQGLLKAANQARANVLAPQTYANAALLYNAADEKLSAGRSIDSIQRDLAKASEGFENAAAAAASAQQMFASALQAEADAKAAGAETFASEQWSQARENLIEAAAKLEDGSEKSAQSAADEAETGFRDAELLSIKANYLDETRRLIEQADKEKVKKYAPATLASAKTLLDQAEQALIENRYDTDEPRSLAQRAKNEAQHALYLATVLKPLRAKDGSLEAFALRSENALAQIADAVDEVPRFDTGYDEVVSNVKTRIRDLQIISVENTDRGYQIIDLKDEIARLEKDLGKQSETLLAQEEQRRRFSRLDSIFTAEDAEIYTQGQSVLLRMVGLNFPQGSAQIESDDFGLLTKLQNAIRLFPEMTVTVEGHTDSFGGDDLNFKLSEDRATAVRSYLLANMTELSEAVVSAIGYGETRPVANNETTQGRARNRRIDVVLSPAN